MVNEMIIKSVVVFSIMFLRYASNRDYYTHDNNLGTYYRKEIKTNKLYRDEKCTVVLKINPIRGCTWMSVPTK